MSYDLENSLIQDPKVSAVVPMYNVGDDLEEALQSLVNQTLKEVQVILIDDGSTDGKTEEIARQFATTYPNFEYHRIPNGGLGHARNYGVGFARGTWLHFMDSDDVIEDFSYEELVALGEKHEVDIVIGDAARFNSERQFPSALLRRAFRNMTEVTHITENHDLIYDTVAWDKLFKRDFYEAHSISWAEGRIYEDIATTIPALFLANKVAFLNRTFYWWRLRDGESASITQKRTEIQNFRDRFAAMTEIDAFFDQHVSDEELKMSQKIKHLALDLPLYLNVLPEASPEYRQEVVETLAPYIQATGSEIMERIPALDRVKYHYVATGDIESLLQVIYYGRSGIETLKISEHNGRFYGQFPFEGLTPDDIDVTRELEEDGLVTDVSQVSFTEDGLRLSFMALIERLSQTHPKLELSLIKLDDAKSYALSPVSLGAPRKWSVLTNKQWKSLLIKHQPQRFYGVSLDNELLESLEPGDYAFSVRYSDAALSCNKRQLSRMAGTACSLPDAHLLAGKIYSLFLSPDNAPILHVELSQTLVTDVFQAADNSLNLVLEDGSSQQLKLDNLNNDERCLVTLEGYQAPGFLPHYFLGQQLGTSADKSTALTCAPDIMELPELISLSSNSAASLVYSYLNPGAVLDTLKITGQRVQIVMRYLYAHTLAAADLVLTGDKKGAYTTFACKITADEETQYLTAEIDFNDLSHVGMLRDDTYLLSLLLLTEEGKKFVLPLYSALPSIQDSQELDAQGYNYRIYSSSREPRIDVARQLKFYESGRLRLEFVERFIYPIMRSLPLKKKLVVFESYWGMSYGCNPGGLYEYLQQSHPDYECVWSLTDPRIAVPGNAKRVVRGTLPYYWALARAKYLINNVNFPDAYKKRAGQVEIQTMHGTPLKTLGLDSASEFKNEAAREGLIERCKRWDYLIVQGPEVETIAYSAYRFEKSFLRTGYPRNDQLIAQATPEMQAVIKQELGIDPAKKLVVYAPTWRSRRRFDLQLDFRLLIEEFGDTYTFALRRHHLSLPTFKQEELMGEAIDLTYASDISKVLLAADVIITDYSSVMFDFALLDRPMFFYTYDLESYRDELRGFYFDFETEAPGPLLKTTDEVLAALRELDTQTGRWNEAYQAFKDKYLRYESAHSSEDIFNQVFK